MGRIIKWIITLGLIGGGVYAARVTIFAPKPVPVRVHRVAPGIVEETVTNSRAGTVKSRHRARLSPEVSGRIIAIPRREGEVVEGGEVLIRLDSSTADASATLAERQLETAIAEQAETEARRDQAARELERQSNLERGGATAKRLLDEFRSSHRVLLAAVTAAEARVEGARAALDRARAERAKTEVKAPFTGVVTKVFGEVGELASAFALGGRSGGSAEAILEIVDLDHLYVSAEIDEVDMGQLKVDLPVRITLDPYPGKDFPGRIVRVAPIVFDLQEKNRTVEIEVEFDRQEDSHGLRPGTSADVEVILERSEGALRIPAHTLLEGNRVLLLQGDHLMAREVEVGLRNWEFVEVLAGLTEGDPVVVTLDREEIREGVLAFLEGEE